MARREELASEQWFLIEPLVDKLRHYYNSWQTAPLKMRSNEPRFKAWEDDGLIPKILHFNGSFNARTIGTSTNPSNHTFGTAFDINAKWNPYRKQPAGIGKEGCLLELVPRASELGFFWGGFYSGRNIDGMHFEYAKL